MKKILGMLAISLITNVIANDKLENYQSFGQRTLIVELKKEDPGKVAKLKKKKPEKLLRYKREIASFNEGIKKGLDGIWTLTENIEYKTIEEINVWTKTAEPGKYAYLKLGNKKLNCGSCGSTQSPALVIYFPEQKSEVVSAMIPDKFENTTSDYCFGVAILQYRVSSYLLKKEEGKEGFDLNVKRSTEVLKSKTLLLESEKIVGLAHKDIEKFYPYPFKVATKEEIEKAILSKDPNSIYVKMPLSLSTHCQGTSNLCQGMVHHILVEASSGIPVGRARTRGESTTISPNELKQYSMISEKR